MAQVLPLFPELLNALQSEVAVDLVAWKVVVETVVPLEVQTQV